MNIGYDDRKECDRELCPAEDCINCENTGCILHPGEEE